MYFAARVGVDLITMPSPAAIARVTTERANAQAAARRERAKAAEAREETRLVKSAARVQLKQQAAAWASVVAMSSLALTSGLVIGGQLSRVEAGWGRWAERGSLVLGMLMLFMARKRWHYLLAFTLLGAGGVQLSDWSRKRDLIPGDQPWENLLPNISDKQERRVTVVAAPKPD